MSSLARTVSGSGRARATLGLARSDDAPPAEGSAWLPRVLLVVDSRFPGFGGAETQALKLAFALQERGLEVEFLAPRVNLNQPLEERYHGIRVTRVDYPHVRWLGSLVLLYRTARRLIARRDEFDAVHVHVTHLMAAGAGFARRRGGLPVTTKISGFYEFEGGVLDPRARSKPLNRIIRRGLTHVDFVQTISEQTRAKLVDAGFDGEQIKFIPNGIDTRSVLPQRVPDGVVRIGYCGRLREIKGVHVLLDAYARLTAQRPRLRFELAVAGDGDTREALEAQARALGIEKTVVWHGHVDETRTAPFYASLDIYVQPSFAEGLPNSVMEAMLATRAVVASDIGGNTDLITDESTGLLFPCGDREQLARRLMSLVDDPGLRTRLGVNARQLIEAQYGFDAVVERLLELYRAEAAA